METKDNVKWKWKTFGKKKEKKIRCIKSWQFQGPRVKLKNKIVLLPDDRQKTFPKQKLSSNLTKKVKKIKAKNNAKD